MNEQSTVTERVHDIAARAKRAQRTIARENRARKDSLLRAIAAKLDADCARILEANAEDLARADESGIDPGLRDRLALNPSRVQAIAAQVRATTALADPVGEVVRGGVLENGLSLAEVRVPLGVIGIIYEARPNVTVDAAALALKSGNAVILRGGSAASSTNRALVESIGTALTGEGFPAGLVASLDDLGREGVSALMRARGLVDVLIPRGGAGLISRVVEESLVPTIETGTGNTHIFVDESADLDRAIDIVVNAKTQRVGVCNALENLLVHERIAQDFLPRLAEALAPKNVVLHADARTYAVLRGGPAHVVEAREEDFFTEYLSLDLAIKVVADVHEAVEHIRTHTSGHTESILTSSIESERAFIAGLDSAVIMVNASTRFSDGGEFGFGAEIGISTQKLHARGPMALRELTSTTWIVRGEGHVRG